MKDLGNPKSKKAKETPQHYEVCEPCKLHLDNNEDIPLPLLAKLIKFKLLSIKANDQKRRDMEKKVIYMTALHFNHNIVQLKNIHEDDGTDIS